MLLMIMHRFQESSMLMRHVLLSLCCIALILVQLEYSNALTPPPGHRNLSPLFGHNGGGGDQDAPSHIIWTGGTDVLEEDFQQNPEEHQESFLASSLRGGSASSDDVVKGSKVTFAKVKNFWTESIDTVCFKFQNTFKSKEQKTQEQLYEQLKTMPVRSVEVKNSTVLPPEVIRLAVKRSGLVGSPLRTDRVQEMAKNLKSWYLRKGYILHTVTGATLKAETATAEIQVEEPSISKIPITIVTCKEMVVDGDELLTFRQYREKHSKRRSFRHDRIEKKGLNTTFVETQGRTKASRIAKALHLKPGRPFRWHSDRWQKIANSGIFQKVLRSTPVRLPDGTVRLQVFVTEPAPRHLEYGLGRSLYTGTWEGELDFEHQNVFGGGESVGFMVRRGTQDPAPSLRVHFGDEHFGLEGGYNFEVFRDYIGDTDDWSDSNGDTVNADDTSKDSMLDRRGATFRLRNPIDPTIVANTVASASLERTSTKTGLHESIGSSTLTLGPFRKALPMDARSSITTSLTGGSRIAMKESGKKFSTSNVRLLPYSTVSATARQILPIASPSERKPVTLALQHTIATSTHNIPRHEARAMGISAEIRGATPDGRASSSVKGTTEIRIPIDVPRLGDGSVVFFGDWFCVQKDRTSSFYGKSSIGIGLRKNFSGLPLKYDVCYSSEGKIKAMFGLGPDFDV
jgi:hypothetical protein